MYYVLTNMYVTVSESCLDKISLFAVHSVHLLKVNRCSLVSLAFFYVYHIFLVHKHFIRSNSGKCFPMHNYNNAFIHGWLTLTEKLQHCCDLAHSSFNQSELRTGGLTFVSTNQETQCGW